MSQAEGNVDGALCFDFPQGICAPQATTNPDPEVYKQPDIHVWSLDSWGDPPKLQGSPCVVEGTIEAQQDILIDLIMDQDVDPTKSAFTLFHTARISGSVVPHFYGNTMCRIMVDLKPKLDPLGTSPHFETDDIPLLNTNLDLLANGVGIWGWRTDENGKTNYICSFAHEFYANDLTPDEIYLVIIRWKFYNVDPTTTDRKREQWGGYEDALHFLVRGTI